MSDQRKNKAQSQDRTATNSPLGVDALRRLVATHGSPLLLLDCAHVQEQYRQLSQALPGVVLHYAVKALPAPEVIKALQREGARFDLASQGETELVQGLGVTGRQAIHTHPIKTERDIVQALRFGCTTFVVDNPTEIDKFIPYRGRVGLLLRVAFPAPDAVCDLSAKFGCAQAEVLGLLAHAETAGVRIKGLSFHIGSQTATPTTMVAAIRECSAIIAAHNASDAPHRLSVLDIGGGFPISYQSDALPIAEYCAPIRSALRHVPSYVRILAEPGRIIVGPAVTSVASVVGIAQRDGRPWYYLDDGVYGSFSGQIYDHARYALSTPGHAQEAPRYPSVLAGPTCDSIDVIEHNIMLPELAPGDLVIGHNMGAYTSASATRFNGIAPAKLIALNQPPTAISTRGYTPMRSRGLSPLPLVGR